MRFDREIRVHRNTVTGHYMAHIPGTTHGFVTGATLAEMLRNLAGALEEAGGAR